jgi:PAN domain
MLHSVLGLVWSLTHVYVRPTYVDGTVICPVRSPFDETVYVTDVANKSFVGFSLTKCTTECVFFASFDVVKAVCYNFNYNSTSTKCSLFSYEPTNYVIDIRASTKTYQVI